MRELQLTDAREGIDDVFSDIVALARECRFTDCRHETEPGCAVAAAIAAGTLDPARLDRFRKLRREEALNTQSIADRRAASRAQGKLYKRIQREKKPPKDW
jgi:ribosome biogenesis GTPase